MGRDGRASRARPPRAPLAVLAALALALTGCAEPAEPTPSPSVADPVVEPTAEPTAEPEPDDVLFTLDAQVRSIDGARIGVRVRTHAPLAWDDPEAEELRDAFVDVCRDGNGISRIDEDYLADMGTSFVRVEFSTDNPGLQFASPLELYFGSVYFPRAGVGSALIQPNNANNCYSGYAWVLSESVTGIGSFENPGGDPDLKQWQYGHYGLSVLPESDATVESCAATITDLGRASGLASVSGWDTDLAASELYCGIGYAE